MSVKSPTHTAKLNQLNTVDLVFLAICFTAIQIPVVKRHFLGVVMGACRVYGSLKGGLR